MSALEAYRWALARLSPFVLLLPLSAGCGSSSESVGTSATDHDATADGDDSTPADGALTVHVGDPCTAASECPAGGSGTVACDTSEPGGYCIVEGCAQHGHDCPDDPGLGGTGGPTSSQCVTTASGTACLRICTSAADCRQGYTCAARSDAAGHGQVNVCVPVTVTDAGTGG